jgi:hypothetical protein
MINEIWRREISKTDIAIGSVFTAPKRITFGLQAARGALSVWFNANDPSDTAYVVLPTGSGFDTPIELVATVCVDGFHVFHLCKVL